MKKNFKYALLSATALMGAVSFPACSSSDDVVDNPDFLPEKNAVKAQFAISLPSNVNAPVTRMIATDVQQTDKSFLGMQDIVMIPFATKPANANASPWGPSITLGDIGNEELQQLSGSTANYKVYSDVTVPLGTSAFLFYAQTQKQESKTTATAKFTKGSTIMNPATSESKSDYTFVPDQIFTGTYTTEAGNPFGYNIVAYLTQIAQTENWGNFEINTNVGLQNLYTAFTSLKAGSTFSVKRAITDLYNSLKNNTDAMSQAIVTNITKTYATASGGVLSFNDDKIGGYPAILNLPDGAAKVTCNTSTGVFSFDNNLNQYVFPAALWYRANTAIKVSNKKQTNTSNIYQDKTTWGGTDGVLSLYTDGSLVTSSTRSIALEDSIQYAVGRFDVQVQCEAASLLDQKGNLVAVPTGGFPVSAILVGGQKAVNYLFTDPTGTEFTIYDKATGVNAKYGSSYGTNYTLALETAAGTDVNIAIELENTTGADFYGQNGQIIPAGSKFYLTTTLTATAATETDNKIFKQDFYTKANLTIKEGTLTGDTNPYGLGAATNTIPDLRTPQLELGLAVDLHWQPGHTFEIQF